MIYHLVVGFTAALVFGGLVFSRQHIYQLIKNTVGLLNVMLSNVDDDTKQKLLVMQLGTVLRSLLLNALLILFAAVIAIGIFYIYSKWAKIDLSTLDVNSGWFYLSLSVGSLIPFIPLMLSPNKSGYSESARLLHQIILDNQNLSRLLFHLDQSFFSKKLTTPDPEFVIVSGLARAGTTAMVTELHRLGNFYSLSYANMPFLMAPNIWRKVYSPKEVEKKERSHGDGVDFGLDSVEALEEYFWKVELFDSYISEQSLREHLFDSEVYKAYKAYQKLLRIGDAKGVYLAKNNNMMLRFEALRQYDSGFKLILMFRNPLDHANSLLQQHKRFSAMQDEDPFILEYMNWLGHHEFGNNQKQFQFEGSKLSERDRSSIEYWLEVWLDYYTSITKFLEDENLLLVSYEDFLEDPKATYSQLSTRLNMSIETSDDEKFVPMRRKQIACYDDKLLAKANELYSELYTLRIR